MASSSSSRSWKYDVFLSFRGEDTRKTFVDHLYSALVDRLVSTYKDDETLPRGDTIGPSLFKSIEESQIAIIIFSKNYADSCWCLDELEYIMKCKEERGLTVLPIFYHVEPADVRKQKRKYKEAFAKYESENDNSKVELWREALVAAGNIAGWEINHNVNGYEAKCIKDIVGTILDKLLHSNSVVDENLIGMGARLQDLKLQLKIGSGGVRMVGIWGIGGGGKTTLTSSLYMHIRGKYDGCCFLESIKDESSKHGMKTLQEKILTAVFNKKVEVESVEIGKNKIKGMLGCRNVLIVLDDVDDRKQLEALAGSHDWFGDGSRILITTRDEHLLRAHKVDEVSHVNLSSHVEAIRLFNKHAYNVNNLVEDYETLSQHFVSYAGGLPLALKVLGSFLCDKDKDEWISTLSRLKDIPEMEIVKILKISYDGLTPLEKELFLDIACFYRRQMKKGEAMKILEACGFHPVIGVKVLIQKALITINSDGEFDMHDLIQEMGHYIVRGEHPNNPETHSRLWRGEDIEDMCSWNATTENNILESIISYGCPSGFGKLVSKAKKLRLLHLLYADAAHIKGPDFLSNELRYLSWDGYPTSSFPEGFQPRKLVVLRLLGSLQEELWRGNKELPCLKELYLKNACNLIRTPDFGGLPCLQKLRLDNCEKLKEIHPSLGSHSSLVYMYITQCKQLEEFPTIVQMGKLETLDISYCEALSKFLNIETNMESLVQLSIEHVGIEALSSTVGKYCTKLRTLKLEGCCDLKRIEGNFHALKHLQECQIQGDLREPIMMAKDLWNENIHLEEFHLLSISPYSIPHLPCFIRRLNLSNCGLKDGEIPCDVGELSNLQELDLSWNEFSRLNFSLLQLFQLKLLNMSNCRKLVELPKLPTSIAILKADRCESLEVVGDIINRNGKWQCIISLRWGRSVICSERLLQTMLQVNGCMWLQLKGVVIPTGFTPPLLLRGSRYKLQLPENWYNECSGFFICAVVKDYWENDQTSLSMKHEKGGSMTGMDSQHDVFWEDIIDNDLQTLAGNSDWDEIYNNDETWVGYVSFGSLKHTLWWNPTSTALEFSLEKDKLCCGFGVRLVSKTSELETTTTTTDSSDGYTPFFISSDSKSHLECRFNYYI